MLSTEQVVDKLKAGKLILTDKTDSKIFINKYYNKLIEDTDYITQMLVQASIATNTPDEAVKFILNDYIRVHSQAELSVIMEELEQGIEIELKEDRNV